MNFSPKRVAILSSKLGASRTWYLDTSVALRILLAHSDSAVSWFNRCAQRGDVLVSSRVLELEMIRVLRREGIDVNEAHDFVAQLVILRIDDALARDAAAIRPHIKTLDALHLASAQRLGAGAVTIVTHDKSMAHVADALGFEVFDPVA